MGKLKDKIKKFDDDDAENYNTIPQMNHADNNPFKLSKVKSTHNKCDRGQYEFKLNGINYDNYLIPLYKYFINLYALKLIQENKT